MVDQKWHEWWRLRVPGGYRRYFRPLGRCGGEDHLAAEGGAMTLRLGWTLLSCLLTSTSLYTTYLTTRNCLTPKEAQEAIARATSTS